MSIPGYCDKNIIQIPKIDPTKNFSFTSDNIKYVITIKPLENNLTYQLAGMTAYGGAYSNNYKNTTGDNRYGAVGNSNNEGKWLVFYNSRTTRLSGLR